MTYRESTVSAKQDQISEFVAYGEPCPFCGSDIMDVQYQFFGYYFDAEFRILVKRRSWSFLWWKAHPAYYKAKCDQCKEYRKELLPVPAKKTV
jgi:hypothetical protein